MHSSFFFFFFIISRGREGGKEVVFSLIRILISQESLGGLIQNNYYISLLSGRQLDKTEFFLVTRLQSIFI